MIALIAPTARIASDAIIARTVTSVGVVSDAKIVTSVLSVLVVHPVSVASELQEPFLSCETIKWMKTEI